MLCPGTFETLPPKNRSRAGFLLVGAAEDSCSVAPTRRRRYRRRTLLFVRCSCPLGSGQGRNAVCQIAGSLRRLELLLARPLHLKVPKSRNPFCPACGSLTKLAEPDGDEKMRAVCSSWGRVHYENPKMVVGCLVEHDNKVLLHRRKIEPAYGLCRRVCG